MMNLKEFFYDWMGANEVIFLYVNHIRGKDYDQLMQWISWAGDKDRFPLYLALISVYVACVLIKKIMLGDTIRRFYMSGWIGVYLMLFLGFAANGFVIHYLKQQVELPRPYIALAKTHKVYKLENTVPKEDYHSFPSGHMAFTTFMVIVLSPMMIPFLQALGLVFVILMAWSRMSLGMHFPADIVGATLITTLLITNLRYFVYRMLRINFNVKC